MTLLLLVCGWTLPAAPALGQYIYLNVSIKLVLNPADGTRPPGVNDAGIDAMIDGMNNLMAGYLRGFRFRRVDPIIEVGGEGQTTGPSGYYNVNFLDDTFAQSDMEDDALDNPTVYRWNAGAINIYVNAGTGGGKCAFPPDELVSIGGAHIHSARLVLHELGHYFELYHTHGRTCGCCHTCSSPGTDEIDDTLPDWPCWDRDSIANNAFDRPYDSLAAGEKALVDDVFGNVMSYHSGGCAGSTSTTLDRLTELQLNRWTDTIFNRRRHVVSGVTRFANGQIACPAANGLSKCSLLTGPFRSIQSAVAASNPAGGDIVIIQPGTYQQPMALLRPVTLRATRQGAVTIGR